MLPKQRSFFMNSLDFIRNRERIYKESNELAIEKAIT